MPRPLATVRTFPFLGLDDDIPLTLAKDAAAVLRNLYIDEKTLVRRGGTTPLGDANLSPNQPHDGMAWCRVGASEHLVAAHNGALVDWLAALPGTTLPGSASRFTSGVDAHAAFLDLRQIWGTGVNQNVAFNGTTVYQLQPDTPAAPALLDLAAGTLAAGTYKYKIVWLGAFSQETAASPAASITIGANRQIRVTRPAIPAGQDITGWSIYRTSAGGASYFFLATVSGTVTATYDDNTATLSASGGVLSSDDRTRMPPVRYLVEHQSRLIGAHCETSEGDLQTVYISSVREPWYCPVLPNEENPLQGTRVPLQGPDAGEITAIHSHGEHLMVWTRDRMFLVLGDQPLDYRGGDRSFAPHGCVAHRTVCSFLSQVVWLSGDGVYMAQEGRPVTRVSENISEFIKSLTASDMAGAVSACFDLRYYLVTPAGSRVLDMRNGQWSEITVFPFAALAPAPSSATLRDRLYAAHNANARAWELETGATDNGTAISTAWQGRDDDIGQPGREKRLHYFGATWQRGTGTATVKLYRSNGELISTVTQDLAAGAEEYTLASVTRLDDRAPEDARSEYLSMGVDCATTDPEYRLVAADGKWSLAT